jgi:hypothetical protein
VAPTTNAPAAAPLPGPDSTTTTTTTTTTIPLRPITRDLRLVDLAAVGTARLPHGSICDVLAVVASIAPAVVRSPLGPKRDLRLADPSTSKRVWLSVFADARRFAAAPGTVALFRSVRVHKFDGGSLNAYRADCEGAAWYVPQRQDQQHQQPAPAAASSLAVVDAARVRRLEELWARIEQEFPVPPLPPDPSGPQAGPQAGPYASPRPLRPVAPAPAPVRTPAPAGALARAPATAAATTTAATATITTTTTTTSPSTSTAAAAAAAAAVAPAPTSHN